MSIPPYAPQPLVSVKRQKTHNLKKSVKGAYKSEMVASLILTQSL